MPVSTGLTESPKTFVSSTTTSGTWFTTSATASGPIENNGVFVFLNGGGLDGWYYANPSISALVNETALACIQSNKKAFVEIESNNILRFHLLA